MKGKVRWSFAILVLLFVFWLLSAKVFGQEESPFKVVLYFPQWGDGQGFSSEIQIDNLSPLPTDVKVTFYKTDGTVVNIQTDKGTAPLSFTPPDDLSKYGSLSITTLGNGMDGEPLISGWAKVEANVRVSAQLVYKYPFGQEVVFPSDLRGSFSLRAEFNPSQGLNTGVALANPTSRSLKVTASLKDPSFRDANGNPQTVSQKEVFLNPNQHLARFINESPLFNDFFASRGNFAGTVEFVVADAGGNLANMNTQVVAMTVRFLALGPQYNFSSSPVKPLPYRDIAEMKLDNMKLVYWVFKDRPDLVFNEYEKYFPLLMGFLRKIVADESERAGFGRKTFHFDQEVLTLTSEKNFSEYSSIIKIGVEVRERLEKMGHKNPLTVVTPHETFINPEIVGMSNDNLQRIKNLEQILASSSGGKVQIKDLLYESNKIYDGVRKVGYVFGNTGLSPEIDKVESSRTFNSFAAINMEFRVGPLYSLFPQVRWEFPTGVDIRGIDRRNGTFSFKQFLDLTLLENQDGSGSRPSCWWRDLNDPKCRFKLTEF